MSAGRTEVLVVGGGPGGLAAATAAAGAGCAVTVLDDNPSVGGQIWRAGVPSAAQPRRGAEDRLRERTVRAFQGCGARLMAGRRVVDAPKPGTLRALVEEDGDGARMEVFRYDRLVLATGARERFLPFPGWTLPGVFGAGGLQALVKGGYDVRGARVVVAGSGPLLLAVAAHLREYGADVVMVAEQASRRQMLPLVARLLRSPGKLWQGARYRWALRRAPYRTGCWPVLAEGDRAVTGVQLTDGRRRWTERCDLLACGFHLVPNTELAVLLGCELDGDAVRVDAQQRTTVPGVYCVGEPTGVAGLEAALLAGRVAGLDAAGDGRGATRLHGRRDAERGFGRALERAFALRPEVLRLAADDTVVCRCEDVRYGQLREQRGWTEAKLQTRCGMGPCQGRICGPATQAMFGWRNGSIRPPLFPVPLLAFCGGGDAAMGNDFHEDRLEETTI